jgi:hypothetical protein
MISFLTIFAICVAITFYGLWVIRGILRRKILIQDTVRRTARLFAETELQQNSIIERQIEAIDTVVTNDRLVTNMTDKEIETLRANRDELQTLLIARKEEQQNGRV